MFAQAQDFVLVNNTGITIYDLYVTEADSLVWGEDILAEQILNDGEELENNFSGYVNDEYLFDILIGDAERNFTGGSILIFANFIGLLLQQIINLPNPR